LCLGFGLFAGFAWSESGSISASPNPIKVSQGTTVGATDIKWTASGIGKDVIGVYVNGTLFNQGGPGATSGGAETGDWVTNGMVFVLKDETNGQTLATVTVTLSTSTCTVSTCEGDCSSAENTAISEAESEENDCESQDFAACVNSGLSGDALAACEDDASIQCQDQYNQAVSRAESQYSNCYNASQGNPQCPH